MTRKHNEDEVLRSLYRKQDVNINTTNKVITLVSAKKWSNKDGEYINNPKRKNDLGNKSHGKIDFLVNYKGYSKVYSD